MRVAAAGDGVTHGGVVGRVVIRAGGEGPGGRGGVRFEERVFEYNTRAAESNSTVLYRDIRSIHTMTRIVPNKTIVISAPNEIINDHVIQFEVSAPGLINENSTDPGLCVRDWSQ